MGRKKSSRMSNHLDTKENPRHSLLEDKHAKVIMCVMCPFTETCQQKFTNHVSTVHEKLEDSTVAKQMSDISSVDKQMSDITSVTTQTSDISSVAKQTSDISSVAEQMSDISSVDKQMSEISTVVKPVKRISCQQCDFKAVNEQDLDNHISSMHSGSVAPVLLEENDSADFGSVATVLLEENDSADFAPIKKQRLITSAEASVSSFSCRICNFHTDNKEKVVFHFKEKHLSKPKRKMVETKKPCDVTTVSESEEHFPKSKRNIVETNKPCDVTAVSESPKIQDEIVCKETETRKILECPHCIFKTLNGGKFQAHLFNKHPDIAVSMKTETPMVSSTDVQTSNNAATTSDDAWSIKNDKQKSKIVSKQTESQIHISAAAGQDVPKVDVSEQNLDHCKGTSFNPKAKNCHICSSKFSTPAILWVHIASLHYKEEMRKFYGQQGFQCGQCTKQFKVKSGLLYHLVVQHNALGKIFESLNQAKESASTQNCDAMDQEDITLADSSNVSSPADASMNKSIDNENKTVDNITAKMEESTVNLQRTNEQKPIETTKQPKKTDKKSSVKKVELIHQTNNKTKSPKSVATSPKHNKSPNQKPKQDQPKLTEAKKDEQLPEAKKDEQLPEAKKDELLPEAQKDELLPKTEVVSPQAGKKEIKISPVKIVLYCSVCKFRSKESTTLAKHIAKQHNQKENQPQNIKTKELGAKTSSKDFSRPDNQEKSINEPKPNTTIHCSKCESYSAPTLKELSIHYRKCLSTIGKDKTEVVENGDFIAPSINDTVATQKLVKPRVSTTKLPQKKAVDLANPNKDSVKNDPILPIPSGEEEEAPKKASDIKHCPYCAFSSVKLSLLAAHYINCSKKQIGDTQVNKLAKSPPKNIVDSNKVTPRSKVQCSLCSFTSLTMKELSIHYVTCTKQEKLKKVY